MSPEALGNGVVEALLVRLGEHAGPELPPGAQEFVRQYYHWVPAEDLAQIELDDLAGAALHAWQTATSRRRGQALINVLNPECERDGFSSPHTVVEIVSDDMPFLVDSVIMELSRQGFPIVLNIHPVIRLAVIGDRADDVGSSEVATSVIHVEVARERDPDRLAPLQTGLEVALEEVRAAVEDWSAMRERTLELASSLDDSAAGGDPHTRHEAAAFLRWLGDDHFTFLGVREYRLEGETLEAVEGTGRGILRGRGSHAAGGGGHSFGDPGQCPLAVLGAVEG